MGNRDDDLVVNKALDVVVNMRLRRRGLPLTKATWTSPGDPTVPRIWIEVASGTKTVDELRSALPPGTVDALAQAGFVVHPDDQPGTPALRDADSLDWPEVPGPLGWNPHAHIELEERPLPNNVIPPRDTWPQFPGLIWVRTRQDFASVYRWSAPAFEQLREVHHGADAGQLSATVRRAAAACGVLQTPNDEPIVESPAGCTVIRRCVPSAFLRFLRIYSRDLARDGVLKANPDPEMPRDLVANDPLMMFTHRQLGHLVRSVTGEQLVASANWVFRYGRDGMLPRHRDKGVGTWVLSLAVDNGGGKPWPILFDHGAGTTSIDLQEGDGVLFEGAKVHHWREAGIDSHRTVLSMGFVPIGYQGKLG